MDYGRIALSEIDWEDRTFEIRGFRDNARLHGSLARFGMLDPPWVLKKGPGYAVVDGFKRLSWARQQGARDTACLCLPAGASLRETWERRIEGKLFEGGLNPAEKARVAAVLLDLYPGDGPPAGFLSSLNIPNRGDLLGGWARLDSYGVKVLEILGSGEIAERAAIELSGWEVETVTAVLELLRMLRCSASIQVEIVERINEISIREEKSRLDVLNGPGLREIMSARDRNHRQKTQALRELLARMRFPRITQREDRFQRDIRSLSPPPSIRIIPPPAFEGDGWKMEISFSGPEEIRSAINSADDMARKDLFDRIFDPGPEERR